MASALLPGAGFSGATSDPGPQGDSGDPFYTAKAICRVATVIDQTISSGSTTLLIGVEAYHASGIVKIRGISENGTPVDVTEVTDELSDGTPMYWFKVQYSDYSAGTEGRKQVRFIAYPVTGLCRIMDTEADSGDLESAFFFYVDKGTLASAVEIYVDGRYSVAGSVTTGTFTALERIGQAGTLATAYVVTHGAPLMIGGITGSPNSSGVWTGRTSGATFTPSGSPVAQGNDSNNGLTTGTPKATLQNAIGVIDNTSNGSNGTIYIRGVAGLTASGVTNANARWLRWTRWPGDSKSATALLYAGRPFFKRLKIDGLTVVQDGTTPLRGGGGNPADDALWIHDCTFISTWDRTAMRIVGSLSGTLTRGETVTQTGTGITAIVEESVTTGATNFVVKSMSITAANATATWIGAAGTFTPTPSPSAIPLNAINANTSLWVGSMYATDSDWINTPSDQHLSNFTLIKNCTLTGIAGDAFQGAVCIINTVATDIVKSASYSHPDFWQISYTGSVPKDHNAIMHKCRAVNCRSQLLFFTSSTQLISNVAMVEVVAEQENVDQYWSQLGGSGYNSDHFIYQHVTLPTQGILVRGTTTNTVMRGVVCRNVSGLSNVTLCQGCFSIDANPGITGWTGGVDPQFVNEATGDWRPAIGSPLPLLSKTSPSDAEGNLRADITAAGGMVGEGEQPDIVNPTASGFAVGFAGTPVTFTLSEDCTPSSGNGSGFTISGVASAVLGAWTQVARVVSITFDPPILEGDTPLLSWNPATTTDDIQDLEGNPLQAFTNVAVTNTSGQQAVEIHKTFVLRT